MSLQLPNLDDRTYDDLMQEALSLLPTYGDDWTNYNPSDPGITLIELFAYVTEILIYRLDRVTDANKQAFLNLITGTKPEKPLDSQALNQAIRSAVLALRRGDRAVTIADFERLALEKPGVARAKCLPRRNVISENPLNPAVRPDCISVIVVPSQESSSEAVIRSVIDHLEPRRLLTTKVYVAPPRYVQFRIQLKLCLKPDTQEKDVINKATAALEEMFAPIKPGGGGWPFGRNIYISEIYELLDRVPGVDYVQPRIQADQPLPELIAINERENERRRLFNDSNELIALKVDDSELVELQILPGDLEPQRTARQTLSKLS